MGQRDRTDMGQRYCDRDKTEIGQRHWTEMRQRDRIEK